MGRLLILIGVVCIVLGFLMIVMAKFGLLNFGKLPGDIVYRGKNLTLHFPIVTCIVLSIALTLFLTLARKF
ncbi:MAG: hypothetical protein CMN58_01660 [Solibacterales bacterium]|nr:hypothetical protein [Bryobacterales bacterium]